MTRRNWQIVGGFLLVAAFAATWIGAHVLRRGLPPPLWAESALPPLADVAEDGWTVLVASGARTTGMDTRETDLFEPDSPKRFADALDHQMAIHDAVNDPMAAPDLRAAAAAFIRPRLTDQCVSDPTVRCPAFALHHLHGVAEIDALSHAVDGDWDAALGQTERLLRADADLLGHSRSVVTQMIALINARHAVALLALLLDGLTHPPVDRAPPPTLDVLRPRLRALSSAVEAVRTTDVDAPRLVVIEYLAQRAILRLAERAASPTEWLFYDERMTTNAIDGHFNALMRYARHPTAVAPPGTPTADGLAWRSWNPIGRNLVMLAPDIAPTLRRFETTRVALLRECGAVTALLPVATDH